MSWLGSSDRKRRNPLRVVVWCGAVVLLLLPWVAMQFTGEVNWGPMDFMVFGAMLLAACGGYELATRMSGSRAYRLAAGLALFGAFLMVWVNLAVGIIGETGHPANLMYMGVIAGGLMGAVVARFQPLRMAGVLFIMALAQSVVAMITVLAGLDGPPNPLRPHLVFNVVMVCLWTGSAWLFHRAGKSRRPG